MEERKALILRVRVRIAVQVLYILIKVTYLLERCRVSAALLGSAFFSSSASWSTFCEMIQNKNNKKRKEIQLQNALHSEGYISSGATDSAWFLTISLISTTVYLLTFSFLAGCVLS